MNKYIIITIKNKHKYKTLNNIHDCELVNGLRGFEIVQTPLSKIVVGLRRLEMGAGTSPSIIVMGRRFSWDSTIIYKRGFELHTVRRVC